MVTFLLNVMVGLESAYTILRVEQGVLRVLPANLVPYIICIVDKAGIV